MIQQVQIQKSETSSNSKDSEAIAADDTLVTAANTTAETVSDPETIVGTSGDDTLDGGAGNDTLTGGAGDDVFRFAPGDGSDTITDFGTGANRLEFTEGLFANLEAVQASAAQVGDDVLIRLSATETLTLQNTSLDDLTTDTVTTLDILGEDTTMNPAPFYFFFEYDEDEGVFVPTGTQNVGSDEAEDLVETLDGNDLLRGFGSDDTLDGGAGNDTLTGGAGDDVFRFAPGDGSDTITDFGTGANRLEFTEGLFANLEAVQASAAQVGDDVLIRLSATETLTLQNTSLDDLTTDTVTTLDILGEDTTMNPAPFYFFFEYDEDEGVFVPTGTQNVGSDEAEDLVETLDGNDLLRGFGSDDTLDGGAGNDTLTGGAGDDVFRFAPGDGSDTITDFGTGANRLEFTEGLFANLEAVQASAAQVGDDVLIRLSATETLTLQNTSLDDLTTDTVTTLDILGEDTTMNPAPFYFFFEYDEDEGVFVPTGTQNVGSDEAEDLVETLDGNDLLRGFGGDDTLDGGAGNDTLTGGAGDDVFRFAPGDGSDTITDFGTGANRLEFTEGLFANLEAVQASAAQVGDDVLIRLSATETLTLQNTSLDDLTTDTVTTLDILGEDTTMNPAPFYFFFEYDEDEGVFVPTGTQNVGSDEAEDLVETLDGNDLLRGFGSDDTLDGGAGNDTLTGGAGDDVFRFAPGDGSDTITDFGTGANRLEFTEGLFANLEAVQASAAQVGDDVLIRLSATETLTLQNTSLDDLTTDTVTTLDILGEDTTMNPAPFYFFFEYDEDEGVFVPTGTQNVGSDEAEDLVETLDGNDLLRGFGGDDTLDGGAGNDTLTGGAGDDVFRFAPGDGSDTITDFGTGANRLEFTEGLFANLEAVQASAAQVGDDVLIRLSATETLTLQNTSLDDLTTDTVTTLDILGEDTTMNPAPFYFFFEYDEDEGVFVPTGTQNVGSDEAEDLVETLDGNDLLRGFGSDDTLDGGAGNDTLTGGAGDDVFRFAPGDGSDTITDFGTGANRLEFTEGLFANLEAVQASAAQVGDDVLIRLSATETLTLQNTSLDDLTTDTVTTLDILGEDTTMNPAPFYFFFEYDEDEGVFVPTGTQNVGSDEAEDLVETLDGNDLLRGFGGDDTLDGGAGNDTLTGGAGDDVFRFAPGDGSDTITDFGTGANRLEFTEGLFANLEAVQASAAQVGDDVLIRLSATETLTLQNTSLDDLTTDTVTTLDILGEDTTMNPAPFYFFFEYDEDEGVFVPTGTQNVGSDEAEDLVETLDGNDLLRGFGSDDTLDGGAGNDTLTGGAGDDVFRFAPGDGSDTITDFGTGANRLEFTEGLFANLEAVQASAAQVGDDVLIRLSATETLTLQNTSLDDLTTDTVTTLDILGEDTTMNPAPFYFFFEYDEDEGVFVPTGTQNVGSDEAEDLVETLDGNDLLRGFGGDDTLDGGAGNDTLTGGAGDDVFRFAPGDGSDTITDFGTGANRLEFTEGLFANLEAVQASAAQVGDDVLIRLSATETLTLQNTSLDDLTTDTVTTLDILGEDTTMNPAPFYFFFEYDEDEGVFVPTGTQNVGSDEAEDLVETLDGNDLLRGFGGDDTLDGGAGNDTLTGGAGDDVFRFAPGDGSDTITDFGTGANRLEFTEGLFANLEAVQASAAQVGDDVLIRLSATETLTLQNTSLDDLTTDTVTTLDILGEDTTMNPAPFYFFFEYDEDEGVFVPTGTQNVGSDEAEDLVETLDGNDLLRGFGGDDTLDGGAGNDTLTGGAGDDVFRFAPGDGSDTITDFGTGANRLEFTEGLFANLEAVQASAAQVGDDVLIRLSATETLTLQNTSLDDLTTDTVTTLDILGEDTTMNPAPFYFFFEYDEDEGVFVPTGTQNVGSDEAEDLVETLDGNDLLRGFGGDDTLDGGAGNDTLTGGAGDDVFRFAPGDGSDTITDFGTGANRLEFTEGLFANLEAVQASAAQVGDDVLIRLSATETLTLQNTSLDDLTTDTVTTLDILGEDTTMNPAPFYFFFEYDEDEGVFVPTGTQNVGSDEAEDLVETLDGNDLLRGFGGDDTLDGGAGNDTLTGGAGDDVFRFAPGDGSDTITDFGTGANRLEFTEGLFANLEAVQASAAQVGDDVLIRLSATETLTLQNTSLDDLTTDTVTTLDILGEDTTMNPAPFYFFFEYDEDEGVFVPTGTQNVGSDEAEDLVETLDGNDLLRGFGGDDTLDGGAGNDTLTGGAGDDVFRFAPGDGSDTITDFGTGANRLEFTEGLFANLEAVQASAAQVGDDVLIRLSATETLTLQNTSLDDLTTDTVTTLDILGEDTTMNPAPFYFFFEYDEDEGVFVPTGTQNVGSDEAEDLVETLDGNDLLRGFGGDDTLDGGAGNDTLTGGAGDDVFRFAPGDGSDTITDFGTGANRLEFTEGLFANLEAVQASAAQVGDDVLIRLSATETLTLQNTSLDDLTTDTVTTLDILGEDTTMNPAPFYFFFEYDEDEGVFVPTGTQNVGSDEAEDLVETLDGNDLLRGFGGDDTLDGGAGNDTLTGGAGDDVFRFAPGDGSDTITDFGTGANRLEFTEGLFANLEAVQASAAQVGDDVLIRLSATETLTLQNTSLDDLTTDTVTTLDILGEDTTMNPAPFYFFFEYDEDEGVFVPTGTQNVGSDEAEDLVETLDGNDLLRGFGGDDTLDGGAGNDTLTGGAGDDVFRFAPGDGSDTITDFGTGANRLEFTEGLFANLEAVQASAAQVGDDVLIRLSATETLTLQNTSLDDLTTDTVTTLDILGEDTTMNPAPFYFFFEYDEDEGVFVPTGTQNVGSDEAEDLVETLDGNDLLRGFGGDDTLDGGAGNDTLTGGAGDDVFRFAPGDGSDTITDFGTGANRLEFTEGLFANLEAVQASAAQVGDDVLIRLSATETLTLQNTSLDDLTTDTVTTLDILGEDTTMNPAPFYFFFEYDEDEGVFVPTGTQNVGSDEAEDLVETLDGNDLLRGFGGDDTLDGGAGNDTLTGGAGDDVFRFAPGDGSDTITDFGTGANRLEFTEGLFANLEAVQASAAQVGDDVLIRLSATETLTLQNTSLDDLTTDTVTTLDILGEDTTMNPAPFYFFFEYDEDEGVFVPTGTQNVGSDEAEDLVETLDGNDLLRGFGGDDTLDGGAGNDTLTGGAGDDVFRFAPGDGSDTITDFGTGANRLEFTEGLFANLEAVQASAAQVGDDVLIRLSATETLTLQNTSLDDLTTDTVTTLDILGEDTTMNPAPFYFFFEYDEDEGVFVPTGTQNVGSDEAEDLVETLDGNDLLRGFGGDDTLDGGAGNDTLTGGAGDDVFRFAPGDGSDTITDFGTGANRLEFTEGLFANLEAVQASAAQVGDDVLIRLSATETLTLQNTSLDDLTTDTVTTLDILGEDTTMNPAPFYFFFEYDEDEGVFVPTGTQNVGSDEAEDLVETLDGNDLLRGFGGDDTLDGGAGNDTLTGGAGDDVFRFAPGDGSDTITDFGTGANRLEFTEGLFANLEAVQASAAQVGDDVLIRLSATETLTLQNTSLDDLTTDTVTTLDILGEDTTMNPAPFYFFFEYDEDEGVFVPTGTQNVGSDEAEDLVETLDGNDLLRGFGGDDTLDGGAGNDTLTGGAGDDVFRFAPGDGSDTITDFGTGANRLEFTEGLFANLEAVQASAAQVGDDVLIRLSATETLTLQNTSLDDLTTDTVTTLDILGEDTTMNPAPNSNSGGADSSAVTPPPVIPDTNTDADSNSGGADSSAVTPPPVIPDTNTDAGGSDTVGGNTGLRLRGTPGDDRLDGGQGNDMIEGLGGNDTLLGLAGRDTLTGGTGNDILRGGRGADRLAGGDGDDALWAGREDAGADRIRGDAGDDVLGAGGGRDRLDGGSGDDTIYGAAGNDMLDGGDGDDMLWGGSGSDRITGGSGADTFYFGRIGGHDHVTDFDTEEDTLVLYTRGMFEDVDALQAAAEETSRAGTEGLLISLDDDTTVFLAGLERSDLATLDLTLF